MSQPDSDPVRRSDEDINHPLPLPEPAIDPSLTSNPPSALNPAPTPHGENVTTIDDFNRAFQNDVNAFDRFDKDIKKRGNGRTQWTIENDTMLLLEALKEIELGGGQMAWLQARAVGSGLTTQAQTYIAWVLRSRGSANMSEVTAGDQEPSYGGRYRLKKVWTAITHLDSASGDPFNYNEQRGYGLIMGTLGEEPDDLMSKKGEEVTGRAGLVGYAQRLKAYRRQPWPFYTKWKEIVEDIRDESSIPRGSLGRGFFDSTSGSTGDTDQGPETETTQSMTHHAVNNSSSDSEHSQASVRRRLNKRKTTSNASGASGADKRPRYGQSRKAVEQLSERMTAVSNSVQQAVLSNESLNQMRKESLKLEKSRQLREAVDLLSEVPESLHATNDKQRFMIRYMREADNMLDFLAQGPILRADWIDVALAEMAQRLTSGEGTDQQNPQAATSEHGSGEPSLRFR